MFAMRHSPISQHCHRFSSLARCTSMTTKCPPPSNCVIDSPHASKAVSALRYRPPHARLGPESPVAMHWSKCYLKLVKRCRNHRYGGLAVAPSLRFVRNTPRHRMKETRSGPRRLGRGRGGRAINYSPASTQRTELRNLRVMFEGTTLWMRREKEPVI